MCIKVAITDNTRDYRFFSGIFFCIRLLLVASFYLLNSPFCALFIGAIITVLGFTVAIVRPQRKYKHYLLDCLVLMILSLLILTTIGRSFQDDNSIQEHTAHLFENIAVGLPIVYISGVVNPRRACAARVTVVVPCVCVCVFPRPSSATRATKRQTRHTGDLSIVFASV